MTLDGRFRAAFAGERGNLFLEPRVRGEQYSGAENEDLNGTDTFFRARGDHEWAQASLEFALDYDQQDIKDAEVTDAFPDDPDIDDPTDPDTGLLIIDEDRKRLFVAPSLEVQISERSSLVFASAATRRLLYRRRVRGQSGFHRHGGLCWHSPSSR